MIIRTDLLQDSCAKIFNAVDSNVLSTVTETLEIECKERVLKLCVTNREYFVQIQVETDVDEYFHATVNANLFLKLISKVTSETIELSIKDNSLFIKCNGDYKIPLIYDGDSLLVLPRIEIEDIYEEFETDSKVLNSIVDFNSRELQKGTLSKPIQRLYYLDSKGCVTFTSGACVNRFDINMMSKLLLNDKLVKLLRLFKDTKVTIKTGHNKISDDVVATVVEFDNQTSPRIKISAVLNCDDTMVTKFPVDAVRGRADKGYPRTVTINKEMLTQAIDRLMLFSQVAAKTDLSVSVVKMKFEKGFVTVSDRMDVNKEDVYYSKEDDSQEEYSLTVYSSDLTKTLDTCTNQLVQISFGDGQALVVSEGNVSWVIPEC